MEGIGVFQAAFLLLVTLRWKISGHSVAVACLTVFLYGLMGNTAAPGLFFIPLVAWARIRLNRHDLAQTIVGSLTGFTFMATLLYIITLRCHGMNMICG